MADFPTFEDLFRIGRDEILTRNRQLTREVVEREGTDANAFVASAAAVGDELVGQLTRVTKGLFLDSAEKDCLDRLIFDRFGLLRKAASPAWVSVAFATATPAVAPFSIPAGTQLATIDGRRFVTTVDAAYPAGSVGPVLVAARSAQAGFAQQVGANTLNTIAGSITGAPGDLTVTNPLASAGAADEEDDDSYRARARLVFETARRGTLAAIRAAALHVPGVQTATAFEVLDEFGRPAKTLQLVISDRFTDALVGQVTPPLYATQSALLAAQVFQALEDTRAGGIYVDVRIGQVVLQSVQLGLRFRAGVNVDVVAFQARTRIVNVINSLAPGSSLIIEDLISALRMVPGLLVTGDEILSPAGDVVAESLQVLRTTLGLVVASSLQPDVALQGSTNPDTL